jgi:thiol-disulfide isomerase/thioredoxin
MFPSNPAPSRRVTVARLWVSFARLCRPAILLLLLPACMGALREGDALPPLNGFKLEGRLPDDLKGRVILLDFWASWCAPCRKSFPALEAIHKKYASQGLSVIAVNVDENRANMERFLMDNPVTFTVVRDAEQKLVAAVDAPSMPTSLVIDRAGKIRFLHHGFTGEDTVRDYEREISSLLNLQSPTTHP